MVILSQVTPSFTCPVIPDFPLIFPLKEHSMTSFESISHRVSTVRHRIESALAHSGAPQTVTLEIAGKTRTPEENYWAAKALADEGQPAVIGHNRVQEAKECADSIRRVEQAKLHLIGPLQSNKINHALACVDLIETVDSPRLIEALDKRLDRELPVFVQVNTSGEDSKSGCAPTDTLALVDAVAASAHLHLAGLMTIGLNSLEEVSVRRSYEELRLLRDQAATRLGRIPESLELSMGMSRDLEWAIAEGATIVRVGTDIFGPRA